MTIYIDNIYIEQLKNRFLKDGVVFNRVIKENGLYITNSVNKSCTNDARIFKETQIKRLLCTASKTLQKKLSYFSQDEKDNSIYKYDDPLLVAENEEYSVQNIGHACLLIQLPGITILTDPVFYDLNKVMYPAKTNSYPPIDKLPKVDVILISHNHADHLDKKSLQKILQHHTEQQWELPTICLPLGDKNSAKSFGFSNVIEIDWFSKITIPEFRLNIISIPADHRSGRYGFDHHKSLVTGWVVNPEKRSVIFKFSGDTRSLSSMNQMAVDSVLWFEIEQKNKSDTISIPDIICFEPCGPNYTRCDMDVTHQSASYSALLKFIQAEHLSILSGKSYTEVLKKFKTVMMHHNKFELGPDRFNESLFVFKKLLFYSHFSSEDLKAEYLIQKEKLDKNIDKQRIKESIYFSSLINKSLPNQTSLLCHSKHFIIDEIFYLMDCLKKYNLDQLLHFLKEYLCKHTVFLKIGERCNKEQLNNLTFNPEEINKYKTYPS